MKILKTISSLTLLLVLLGTTSGISVYKHYCGDLLEEISVFVQSNPCAGEGGEDACSAGKEMSCCDDETEYYQLEVDLVKTSHYQINFNSVHKPVLFGLSQKVIFEEEQENLLFYIDSPPLVSSVPIYKKLKRFMLYG